MTCCELAGAVLAVFGLGVALSAVSEIARLRQLCRAERRSWLSYRRTAA